MLAGETRCNGEGARLCTLTNYCGQLEADKSAPTVGADLSAWWIFQFPHYNGNAHYRATGRVACPRRLNAPNIRLAQPARYLVSRIDSPQNAGHALLLRQGSNELDSSSATESSNPVILSASFGSGSPDAEIQSSRSG